MCVYIPGDESSVLTDGATVAMWLTRGNDTKRACVAGICVSWQQRSYKDGVRGSVGMVVYVACCACVYLEI